jgi:CRP-like cAMP-binding protein
MSLLDTAPASATVRTRARSWVLLLPRDAFEQLATAHPQVRDQLTALATERRAKNRAADEGRLEPV